MSELTVISLGWGVQSWTLAAMVALGDLPPVDFAIHSDTTWERSQTYQFAAQWTPWLEDRGIRVVTVSDGRQAAKATTAHQTAPWFTTDSRMLPVYTLMNNGRYKVMIPARNGNDSGGQLRRQCTNRWKIQPMRRYIAAELKRRSLNKTPGIVEQWLGITTDEVIRAKDSDVKYIQHRYPLLELNMSRGDCLRWLADHNLPSPGKSACTFCPYHSMQAWREMKREDGPDWEQAVAIDAAIRDKRPPFDLFVHQNRVPLEQAVDIPEDHGYTQPGLFDEECDSGYCFL